MSRTDRASLLIHVHREDVFTALTSEAALLSWLPPKGMHGRFERFDMRNGGSYRLVLTYEYASDSPGKTSPNSDVSEVRISRIDPGARIVQDVDFESDEPALQGQCRWSGICAASTRERSLKSWHGTSRKGYVLATMRKGLLRP
jgi:uncharacterized protein YndB with AHSA1/START domain